MREFFEDLLDGIRFVTIFVICVVFGLTLLVLLLIGLNYFVGYST